MRPERTPGSWLPRVGLVTAVAVAARLVTFGNPHLHVDEEFYLTVARAMASGKLLYVDVWDRKPVGIFLIYFPAALMPGVLGVWVCQAMALVSVVLTALLIAALAGRAGWRQGATVAALLYPLWLDLADGQGGQTPVFYNLAVAAAVWLALTRGGEAAPARRRGGLLAMLLVGAALQVKYAAVFEGLWIGCWLLWQEKAAAGWRAALVHGAALIGAALLPTALAAGFYAAIGQGEAFAYANFISILHRGSDPPAEQWGNALGAAAILAPLLLLAVAGMRVPAGDGRERSSARFLRGWLLASIVGLVVFGSWFNHYTLPVMVPAACCAAAVLGTRAGRRLAPMLLILAFAAGQFVLQSERRARGTPGEFAAIVRAIGGGPGSLYVYSGFSGWYDASGRPAPTRYLLPAHLQAVRERGAIGADQQAEIARILRRRPAVVVVQSPTDEERADLRALVLAWLSRQRYARAARLPLGGAWVEVFRAPTTPPTPAPPG